MTKVLAPGSIAAELVGERCWAVTADARSGLLLHLGRPEPRPWVIENPTLPTWLQRFRGSRSLFVRSTWQLARSDEWLDGWDHASRLEGESIVRVTFGHPRMDLSVAFTGDLLLVVHPRDEPDRPSYTVGLESVDWTVRGVATIEQTAR